MATFAAISKGHRARRPVAFPVSGAKWSTERADWDGETVTVDLRPLRVTDELEAVAAATARAKKLGISDPGDGDPVYDYALEVERLLRGVVDHDSPTDAPVPFFESFEQIAEDEAIQKDHVAYLSEQLTLWQAECSPRASTMNAADFSGAVLRAAGGDARDFLGWSPALRWSFLRSTAVLASSSLLGSLPSGSPSDPTPSPAPPASPPSGPQRSPAAP